MIVFGRSFIFHFFQTKSPYCMLSLLMQNTVFFIFYFIHHVCFVNPGKGNIQKDAPSFLNVVLLGPLPPSTVSWDKQALPATQRKERIKVSKGSEPTHQDSWGEGKGGMESNKTTDKAVGLCMYVLYGQCTYCIQVSRYAQSSQTVCHAFYIRDLKIQWISVENSPTV